MGHLNSKLIWEKYAAPYFTEGMQVLEIGPAGYPSHYQQFLQKKKITTTYHCLDVRTDFISGAEKNPDFIYAENEYHYPIETGTYDIVFSDQVLAHVPIFWDWYKELVRITKAGGLIITICSQTYPSCPSPIDAWRVSADGVRALNKYSGVETLFAITDSEEAHQYGFPLTTGKYYGGASLADPLEPANDKIFKLNMLKRKWNSIIGSIPKLRALLLLPVQVSFDTISIARKP